MTSRTVSAGAIAFVGPSQVTTLEGFSYLLVVRVQGSTVFVRKTGPEVSDSSPEFEVKSAILRHRIVDEAESELWPGSYVGHPIAFVHQVGDSTDQWAYGLVTGYTVQDGITHLHVRQDAQALRIPLSRQPTVIAVDRLNYALSTGASVNATVLNAHELLDQQNEIIAACGKSRSGLPSQVTSTMLSVPFEPEERVPLIRPDTLQIVYVRRQHIVDCELTSRGSSRPDVFVDSVPSEQTASARDRPNFTTSDRLTNNINLAFSDSDDETKEDETQVHQRDIDLVRLQNRPLRKRARFSDSCPQDLQFPDDDFPAFSTTSEANASSFRPSTMERHVNDAIAHPSLKGKNAQAACESAQQGPRTKFLATPPVLRLSYDFSFGMRGLSCMHFRRFIQDLEQQNTSGTANMTNFGRSNTLLPATQPTSITEIVDAFQTLLFFAEGFYNDAVCGFIKAGVQFFEKFAATSRPDTATCNMLVFWANSKLGKFRSAILTSDIGAAVEIGREFTRNDDHLMELYQTQHDRQLEAIAAPKSSRTSVATRQYQSRDNRSSKASTVPHELISLLPKQGGKVMCMRFLSRKGCTGPAPGLCFDPNRAHFRPLALPADAKAFIDKNFLGLAPEFSDL